jgi:hypothetical protein
MHGVSNRVLGVSNKVDSVPEVPELPANVARMSAAISRCLLACSSIEGFFSAGRLIM